VCAHITTWEPESCEEVTADYLECLRQLTCEERAARAEAVEQGPLPCDDEQIAAADCAN